MKKKIFIYFICNIMFFVIFYYNKVLKQLIFEL